MGGLGEVGGSGVQSVLSNKFSILMFLFNLKSNMGYSYDWINLVEISVKAL